MGLVYFLQNGNANLFKIGHTKRSTVTRINQLATGNPEPLTLFDAIETEHFLHCENYLHNTLLSKRLGKGGAREFFVLAPEEVRAIVAETKAYLAIYGPLASEVELLSKEKSAEKIKTPGDKELAIYRELIKISEGIHKLTYRKEILENKLKQAIGISRGFEGIATWLVSEPEILDQTRFKLEHPDIYKLYLKVSLRRTFRLN
jgi:hypothetical protein